MDGQIKFQAGVGALPIDKARTMDGLSLMTVMDPVAAPRLSVAG